MILKQAISSNTTQVAWMISDSIACPPSVVNERLLVGCGLEGKGWFSRVSLLSETVEVKDWSFTKPQTARSRIEGTSYNQ